MFSKAFTLLALAGMGSAHMHLHYPPTFKGDNNPNTQGEPDPELNYPYGCCGKEAPGPCKGYVDLLDTDEGKPVATWTAGQQANFSLSGSIITGAGENPQGGTHYGGSCQVGFSTDKGKTFKVATTFQGNCPLRANGATPEGQTFDFTVPADLPSAERVLFAWTWVNREKEFYMNCASVTIEGAVPAHTRLGLRHAAATSATESDFSSRPDMLISIDYEGATCHSKGNSFELEWPEPGPDVVQGDGEYPLEKPTCS
ncbi:hypothetical protein BS50DRAFT_596040 [Corynespora cassiicola Philippines]|uniref:Lytic polysaccharide monooxygenase n=1 Tax=Corynespora cassiicola Philippines TaxID=1448308 RepID=A0A2T2PB30_CORCC|nr:hypothetical protein BS50DRAFT_596040 [Corynespora cassiicola Philippines]